MSENRSLSRADHLKGRGRLAAHEQANISTGMSKECCKLAREAKAKRLPQLEKGTLLLIFALFLVAIVYSNSVFLGIMSAKFFYIFSLTCLLSCFSIVRLIVCKTDGISFRKIDFAIISFLCFLVIRNLFLDKASALTTHQIEKYAMFYCGFAVYFSLRIFSVRDGYGGKLHKTLTTATVFIVFIEFGIVCLQKLYLIPSLSDHPKIIITGTFSHPAMLGGLLAMLVPYLYARIRFGAANRPSSVAVLLLGCLTLLMTESRAAFLGTVFSLLIIELSKRDALGKINRYVKRRKWLSVVVVAAVFGFAIMLINIRSASVWGRILVWKIATPMISDAPFLGHGFGSFPVTYPGYQIAYFGQSVGNEHEKLADFVLYAYNDYLQMAVELGTVGLSLFLLVVLSCVFSRYSVKDQDKTELGPKMAIISLAVFGFFSYPFSLNYAIFYFFLFAAVSNLPMPGSSGTKASTLLGVFLAMSIPFTFAKRTLNVFSGYRQVQKADLGSFDAFDREEAYSAIYFLLKNDGHFISKYARLLNGIGDFERGKSVLLEKKGLTYQDCLLLGDLCSNIGQSDSAVFFYKRAKLLLPNQSQPDLRILREKSLEKIFTDQTFP